MKIAIFGGSFDPVHEGHEQVVKKALDELGLDQLIIVPAFLSPFKQAFSAPPRLRFAWLAKVFNIDINQKNEIDFNSVSRIFLSDYEISQNRPVPSIETVKHYASLYPGIKIFFIIGADHLGSLDKWHKIGELRQMAEFVVASRDGFAIPPEFKHLNVDCNISSSFIRDKLIINKVNPNIRDEVIEFYKGLK